jgi:predicted ester cyclase
MKKTSALTALMALAFCVLAAGNAVADEARNEAIIERNLEEIWHNKNYYVADEIVAENYVRHNPGGQLIRGRDAYKEMVKAFMTTCPDTHFNMDIVISKGDYVVVHYSGTMTHTGPGMGEPTGKKSSLDAIVIHRLAAGKMVECWSRFDNLSFMTQLGYKLIPPE